MKLTKELIQAQDEVLGKAWREGALNDTWYNEWIQNVYVKPVTELNERNSVDEGEKSFVPCIYCNAEARENCMIGGCVKYW